MLCDLHFIDAYPTEGLAIDCESVKSSATLLDSLKNLQWISIRKITLENVGGCPAQEVLSHLTTTQMFMFFHRSSPEFVPTPSLYFLFNLQVPGI